MCETIVGGDRKGRRAMASPTFLDNASEKDQDTIQYSLHSKQAAWSHLIIQ